MDVQPIEQELQELSEALTRPLPRECLSCYLDRMLGQFWCVGHRFTRRWAQGRVRGTEDGLVRWAASLGGLCCDCEVVMNTLNRDSTPPRRTSWAATDEEVRDAPVAPCSGVDG